MEITKKDIEKLRTWKYPQEGFKKFYDPNDPQYGLYKDRQEEKAQDFGFNQALDFVIQMLENGKISELEADDK